MGACPSRSADTNPYLGDHNTFSHGLDVTATLFNRGFTMGSFPSGTAPRVIAILTIKKGIVRGIVKKDQGIIRQVLTCALEPGVGVLYRPGLVDPGTRFTASGGPSFICYYDVGQSTLRIPK